MIFEILLNSLIIIQAEGPAPEILMKRRLTIASPDEVIPEGVDEIMEPLPEDG